MYEPPQLDALAAVVAEGSFEGAAHRLRVTPSAVSQRIKALERAVGQMVLTRTRPCRPTAAGEVLLRYTRQAGMLAEETLAELGAGGGPGWVDFAMVVNADSLATWFAPVLPREAGWGDVALHLQVEDQQFSARQLRAGAVMAAVTADPRPVQGCTVQPLGSMRYVPVAAAALAARYTDAAGRLDLGALPMLRFNDRDDEQHAILRAEGLDAHAPVHQVPGSAEFVTAVEAGVGWGALPKAQLADGLSSGRLVRVSGCDTVVELYWQRWRIDSRVLRRITGAVLDAARRDLTPLRRSRGGGASVSTAGPRRN